MSWLRLVEGKIAIGFATFLTILHLLTSLQLCFADVSLYVFALFYADIVF